MNICTACNHDQVEAINAALVNRVGIVAIAKEYGLSKSAVGRHKLDCLPAAITAAASDGQLADGRDLLFMVNGLMERTERALTGAQRKGDNRTALQAIREVRENMKFLSGLLESQRTQNSIPRSEVLRIVERMADAVAKHVSDPDALTAIEAEWRSIHV